MDGMMGGTCGAGMPVCMAMMIVGGLLLLALLVLAVLASVWLVRKLGGERGRGRT